MQTLKQVVLLSSLLLWWGNLIFSQDKSAVYKPSEEDTFRPIKINMNSSGSKYLRVILHGQISGGDKDLGAEDSRLDFKIARARIIAFGQFSPRFLMLLQIGTHQIIPSKDNAAAGKGYADLFFNDFTGEYMLFRQRLYLGAGLHYWSGISRLGRLSTQRFLTLGSPNNRVGWFNFGRTGQFVREFGVYLKGNIQKRLQWSVSINDAQNSYAETPSSTLSANNSIYGGAQLFSYFHSQKARLDYTARVEYNFFDVEGDKFPFKSGGATDMKKHILNAGAGAFYHPHAAVNLLKSNATIKTFSDLTTLKSLSELEENIASEDAFHFAVDIYYERKGFSFYGLYQRTNYGKNAIKYQRFTGSNWVFTSGYLLPSNRKIRYEPYLGYNILLPDVIGTKTGYEFKAGINLLHLGNFMKTTFEYQHNAPIYSDNRSKAINNLMIQMQFIL